MSARWVGRIAPAALLAFTVFAAADDSVSMLLPGEKVTLSLSPSGEKKTVSFAGIEGTIVVVDAKRAKGSKVVPRLSVLSVDGSSIDVGDTNPKSGGTAQIKRLEVGTSGVLRIGVSTPSDNGGACTVSTKCKVPTKFSWTKTLTGDAPTVNCTFAAAPGGTTVVTVAAKGKPKFDPSLDLISSSGEIVAHVTGARGKATIRFARLEELGAYVVRVSGGPGQFSARATVKPAKKRVLTFRDVESRPELRGFSPASVTNDDLVNIQLDGFAFSTQQLVSIVAGAATKAALIEQITEGGASVDIDLTDVPPGTYELKVATAEGSSTTAATPIVVTNRRPAVAQISPPEISNKYPIQFDIRGVGFDSTATLSLRHAASGVSVPVQITSRHAHDTILATAIPQVYLTGPCDLEVRDPDGGRELIAGGVDLLGFSRAPVSVNTLTGAAASQFFNNDAAYDEANGRVLVAVRESVGTCRFVLFDSSTLAVVDSLVLTGTGLSNPDAPRVAWNSRDATFALTCVGTSTQGYVRVVPASNLHFTLREARVGTGNSYRLDVAANPVSGGFVLAWDDYVSGQNTKMKTLAIPDSGGIDPLAATAIASETGTFRTIGEPCIEHQDGGRFVVAWTAFTNDHTFLTVRETVLDAAGHQSADAGPYEAATSKDWYNLFGPELAKNPEDGSMLLAYSYLDVTNVAVFRPACQRLAPVSADPAEYTPLDANGQLPEGYFSSVVWNPARHEYVVAMSNALTRVALRRVNPSGSIRPTSFLESYEGWWGILYSGSAPGTMGLVRKFDGVDDDFYNLGTTAQSLAGPIR